MHHVGVLPGASLYAVYPTARFSSDSGVLKRHILMSPIASRLRDGCVWINSNLIAADRGDPHWNSACGGKSGIQSTWDVIDVYDGQQHCHWALHRMGWHRAASHSAGVRQASRPSGVGMMHARVWWCRRRRGWPPTVGIFSPHAAMCHLPNQRRTRSGSRIE